MRAFNHLVLTEESELMGKWFLFEFDSFSAAKKTLEKFRFEEWFGINKFWVKGSLIACEATDGREDFENGLVVTQELIEENIGRYWSYEAMIMWSKAESLHYFNECAMMLIENDIAVMAPLSFDDDCSDSSTQTQ